MTCTDHCNHDHDGSGAEVCCECGEVTPAPTCHWCGRTLNYYSPRVEAIELVRLDPVYGRPVGDPVVSCLPCAEVNVPGERWGLA